MIPDILAAVSRQYSTFEKCARAASAAEPCRIGGLVRGARPLALACLSRVLAAPMLCLTASAAEAERLTDDLAIFLEGQDVAARLFPPREVSMFDAGESHAERLAVLDDVRHERPVLIVASLLAVLQATVAPARWQSLTLRRGQQLDLEKLTKQLSEWQYEAISMVEHRGQFARHGQRLDVLSPGGEPVRLDVTDGSIRSLRAFDVDTQRSTRDLESTSILPLREEAGAALLFDWLPATAPVILIEPDELRWRITEMGLACQGDLHDQHSAYADIAILHDSSADDWGDLLGLLGERPRIELFEARDGLVVETREAPRQSGAGEISDDATHRTTSPPEANGDASQRASNGAASPAARSRSPRARKPRKSAPAPQLIVSQQADRLRERFPDATLMVGSLSLGVEVPPIARIVSDAELFGVSPRPRHLYDAGSHLWMEDLQPGNLVVHDEHGIGRFDGLITLDVSGGRELLKLTYAEEQHLFVPVEQMQHVHKYLGAATREPALHHLDRAQWFKTVAKVQTHLDGAARKLLSQRRSHRRRHAAPCAPDTALQRELEAAFPYDLTPDQRQAVDDIKRDMEEKHPMNRLLCGDVGYGKTEVALRAAFKAQQSGLQVAVLVPTTVLAQQHFERFRERLTPFRVRVAGLWNGLDDTTDVREALRAGDVDVVIGTHSLLGADLEFARLGLLIVDEEQRFGVKHKERLEHLSRGVHTLSMSATPIPRTLQLSLVGVRDVSLLDTPPAWRRPVRTYLAEDDDDTLLAALTRELERGGQAFVLQHKVETLEGEARRIAEMLPQARVAIAHGQMDEDELATAFENFRDHRIDVLVCTTVIEAGVDLPNANTIVVRDADRFGLGQLYQLRGRVGRSTEQGYCYLLVPTQRDLSPTAALRLQTLRDFTALGAGYQIALRDLQIRGAGDLLGEAQSGDIGKVGFVLYHRMLAASMRRARQPREVAEPESARLPVLELGLDAYLPASYVEDERQRLTLYRRISELEDAVAVDAFGEELEDRFGPLPAPARQLLVLARLRLLAAAAGVRSVRAQNVQGKPALVVAGPVTAAVRNAMEQALDRAPTAHDENLVFPSPPPRPQWPARLARALMPLAPNPHPSPGEGLCSS